MIGYFTNIGLSQEELNYHLSDINKQDDGEWTPLMWFVKHGDYDSVKLLLDNGALTDNTSAKIKAYIPSYTPMYNEPNRFLGGYSGGYSSGYSGGSSSSQIEKKTIVDESPLMIASKYGYDDIVELLIERGANIHYKNLDGYGCLFQAVRFRQFDTIELLLSKGIKINGKTNNNYNPFIFACKNAYSRFPQFGNSSNTDPILVEAVKLLLSYGADPHESDLQGVTCYNITRSKDVKDILHKWPTTMLIIVFQELLVYHQLDCCSFIDLFEYIGSENDYL